MGLARMPVIAASISSSATSPSATMTLAAAETTAWRNTASPAYDMIVRPNRRTASWNMLMPTSAAGNDVYCAGRVKLWPRSTHRGPRHAAPASARGGVDECART